MTELTQIIRQQDPVTPEQADHITASWQGLLRLPIATDEQCDEIANVLSVMQEEARPAWVMARVAALLSQYYAADVPPSVVAIMAEDWREELRPYPQWAITKAVRWWKSGDNPERKRRPLEGDIAARAHMEMAFVRFAERKVQRYWKGERPASETHVNDHDELPPITPEEREASRKRIAEMCAEVAGAKRMGPLVGDAK